MERLRCTRDDSSAHGTGHTAIHRQPSRTSAMLSFGDRACRPATPPSLTENSTFSRFVFLIGERSAAVKPLQPL